MSEQVTTRRRRWPGFLIWVLITLAIFMLLVYLNERYLPPNF